MVAAAGTERPSAGFNNSVFYDGAPDCIRAVRYAAGVDARSLRIGYHRPFSLTSRDGIVCSVALGGGGGGVLERIKGRRRFTDAGRLGRMLVDLPGDEFSVATDGECRVLQLRLDAAQLASIADEDHGIAIRPATLRDRDGQPCPQLLTQLSRVLLGDRLQRELAVREVVACLAGRHDTGCRAGGLAPVRLRRVMEAVAADPDDITLAGMAAAAGLSPFHFAREFRRETGLSPRNFVLRQRVLRAAQLLGGTGRTLDAVARASGFAHASHLGRAFRRQFGATPAMVRLLLP